MFLDDPYKGVNAPTFFMERINGLPGLHFGCIMPSGMMVRFEPIRDYDPENDEVTVLEIGVSRGVFNISPQELAFVEGIFAQFERPMLAYFSLCVYSQLGPIPYEEIKTALSFNLDKRERQAIESEMARFTYIYVIRDRRTNYIKIGKSNNPAKRLQELKKQVTLLPTENDFVLLFYARYYEYMERALHKKFTDQRVRGEWFNLTDEAIAKLRNELNNYTDNGVIDCF